VCESGVSGLSGFRKIALGGVEGGVVEVGTGGDEEGS